MVKNGDKNIKITKNIKICTLFPLRNMGIFRIVLKMCINLVTGPVNGKLSLPILYDDRALYISEVHKSVSLIFGYFCSFWTF